MVSDNRMAWFADQHCGIDAGLKVREPILSSTRLWNKYSCDRHHRSTWSRREFMASIKRTLAWINVRSRSTNCLVSVRRPSTGFADAVLPTTTTRPSLRWSCTGPGLVALVALSS
jgi:hypothetical protein